MISTNMQSSALRALHHVLLVARAMGYQNEPGPDIARVLDDAEYLVVLMIQAGDTTAEFREYVESLAQSRENFLPALRCLDEP